jgi:outer membrane protein OmpA-like peptidoglycan-associated protein
MTVTFNYGTFVKGVELSDDAKKDLKAIAAAVKAKGSAFRIEVEGHTDAAKISSVKSSGSNNRALGLARAKVVASYLTTHGNLPSTSITTSSSGEDNPPFPNTTTESQKKNRTVVLKIRPATGP